MLGQKIQSQPHSHIAPKPALYMCFKFILKLRVERRLASTCRIGASGLCRILGLQTPGGARGGGMVSMQLAQVPPVPSLGVLRAACTVVLGLQALPPPVSCLHPQAACFPRVGSRSSLGTLALSGCSVTTGRDGYTRGLKRNLEHFCHFS